MAALAYATYFNQDGSTNGADQKTLPDWLDWKSIEEKEQYLRHIGGFPPGTRYALVNSQGQSRLITNLEDSVGTLGLKTYKERADGAEAATKDRCRERRIDTSRKPRNQ